MKLKKFAALLLAAVMTLSMAACTKEEGQAGGGEKEEEKERIRRNSPDFLLANQTHVVQRPGMELRIPNGALVNDERLEIKMTAKPDCVSNTYRFSDDEIPLLKRATLMISPKMATGDLSKYYIASSKGYVGNQCDDGWLVAQIRDLTETYEIMQDPSALAPFVTRMFVQAPASC